MRAVILAAGMGTRLAAGGERFSPKCLLRFGGRTLLERHLRNLEAVGAREIILVVGHGADRVEAALAGAGECLPVATVRNERYREGSVLSLWCARAALEGDAEVLLMDADVLYDCRLLKVLVTGRCEGRFLLDRELEPGEEPVKLCVRDGRIVEFRKRLAPDLECDLLGESVGFFRLSGRVARRLAARCEEYVGRGRTGEPYEEALRDELLSRPEDFEWKDVTGIPWIEIDYPEDVRRAESEVLPRLLPPGKLPA